MLRILAYSLVSLAALPATAEEPASPLGNKVADFTLKDYRGKTHSLADYKEKQLVIVAFLGTECPLAKLYAPRLQALHEKYQADVAFLGINANRQDSITEIAAHARRHNVAFPVLKDLGNERTVRWGDQTWEEMMIGYFDVAVPHNPADDGQPAAGKPDETDKRLAELLNRYDKDNSGTIEKSETPDRLHPIFDRLDADENDSLSQKELHRLLDLLPR